MSDSTMPCRITVWVPLSSRYRHTVKEAAITGSLSTGGEGRR